MALPQSESDSIIVLTSSDEHNRELHLVSIKDGGAALLTTAPVKEEQHDIIIPQSHVESSTAVTNLRDLRDALNEYLDEGAQLNENSIRSSRTDIARTATMEEMRRFELFREVITHEDDLLNQRVSWIILAQSFLMAAYVTAGGDPESDSLRFVTAAVGLATVFVTLPAIYAAGRNVEVQQRVYFQQIESDERCLILHGHKRDLSLGAFEERDRILYGHILPTMAFRSRSAIKILFTATSLALVQLLGWIFLLIAVIDEWQ